MKGKCSFCREKDVEVEATRVENTPGFICEKCKGRYSNTWHKFSEPERYKNEEKGGE